jgi:hypothetical protein
VAVQLISTVGITLTAVTAGQASPDFVNPNARGVTVYLKTTAIGTGSITVTIQGKDTISGDYYTLLAGAAVITNTVNRYTVYPGIPVVANVTASDVLPYTWRISVASNNANPVTASIGASTLVSAPPAATTQRSTVRGSSVRRRRRDCEHRNLDVTFGGTSAIFDQSVSNAIAFTKTLSVAGSFTTHWCFGFWVN